MAQASGWCRTCAHWHRSPERCGKLLRASGPIEHAQHPEREPYAERCVCTDTGTTTEETAQQREWRERMARVGLDPSGRSLPRAPWTPEEERLWELEAQIPGTAAWWEAHEDAEEGPLRRLDSIERAYKC